jgi:4-hydroxy-tetrahydrodipicolinate reductase
MLTFGLIGYGKMGRMVEAAAGEKGHNTVILRELTPASVQSVDVAIDFTHPDVAMDHLRQLASLKKSLVMGTTGWYDQLETAKRIVEGSGIGFFYAPNFSIGVHLFMKVVKEAARLINHYPDYDVAGFESHHNQKADSPSGTAKALKGLLERNMQRKRDVPMASLRVGSVPGTHSIIFDSPADTISLTHTARNREGFARGAVTAAEWLKEKKGFFTMEDLIS